MNHLKISPIVEIVLKIHRIKLLVEQMILKESLGGWAGGFVFAPDGKYIPLGGMMMYHGETLRLIPKLWNIAVKEFGGEDQVDREASAGSDDLYNFMYKHGMVRGGKTPPWLAFDSRKVSSKSLMGVLQIAKESNIKFMDVEDVHNRNYYRHMSVDEFIEKFL